MKHLPDLGYNPIVISSWIEKKNKWTPTDSSLAKEVPPSIQVNRLPDNQEFAVLSNTKINNKRTKGIAEIGHEMTKSHKIALVYVSLSPFGDLPAAIAIARQHRLPVVADLRDPWALDEFQTHRSWYHRNQEVKLMGSLLAKCDRIIMNTPESVELLCDRFKSIPRTRVTAITNGYDPEDFHEARKSTILDGKFYNIVHTGTFHTDYAFRQKRQRVLNFLLGRTEPGLNVLGRTPNYLFEALASIKRNNPEIYSKIQVTFAGVSSLQDVQLTKKFDLSAIVNSTDYLDHDSCIQYTREANMLFLPLHGLARGKRCSIVPGKTYEYLASDATILGALPEGDAKDFVAHRSNCHLSMPDEPHAMARSIIEEVERWQAGDPMPPVNRSFTQQFERQALARKLAETFSQVLSHA